MNHIEKILETRSHKQQLYCHLPPITKTILIRWTKHTEHYWRSKDELISNVLLWKPSHGGASVGQPTRTYEYLPQLCTDTVCSLEGLPKAMDDRYKWWERVREIHASSMTWWWWYIYKVKVKLVTLVDGNPKIPFQQLRQRGVEEGATSFPVLFHFTLDSYLIVLSAKQGDIKYHFLSLWCDSKWDWLSVS